jgi:hypothetical protein
MNIRLSNLEKAQFMTANRIINLESRQQEPEEMPQPVRKSSKKEQPAPPQQPVPAWQQQKPIVDEPVKKAKPNSKKLILFIIVAVAVTFLIGNCQAIISYVQPAAGG